MTLPSRRFHRAVGAKPRRRRQRRNTWSRLMTLRVFSPDLAMGDRDGNLVPIRPRARCSYEPSCAILLPVTAVTFLGFLRPSRGEVVAANPDAEVNDGHASRVASFGRHRSSKKSG